MCREACRNTMRVGPLCRNLWLDKWHICQTPVINKINRYCCTFLPEYTLGTSKESNSRCCTYILHKRLCFVEYLLLLAVFKFKKVTKKKKSQSLSANLKIKGDNWTQLVWVWCYNLCTILGRVITECQSSSFSWYKLVIVL